MTQASLPAGMLETVRALLAKAESTDYEAEAETVDDVVTTTAERAETAIVPLLGARKEATRAAVERLFPNARTFAPPASDREGFVAGAAFADRADLGMDSRPLP